MSKASRAAYQALEETPSIKYGKYDVTKGWKYVSNPRRGISGVGYIVFNPNDPTQKFGIEDLGGLGEYLTIGGRKGELELPRADWPRYFGIAGEYQELFNVPRAERLSVNPATGIYESAYGAVKATQRQKVASKTKVATTGKTITLPSGQVITGEVAEKYGKEPMKKGETLDQYITRLGGKITAPTPTPAGKAGWQEIGGIFGYYSAEGKLLKTVEESRKEAGLPITPTTPTGFGPSSYTGVSVIDYLKSVGQPSGFSSRAKLAAQYGITGYLGTEAQNTKLLGLLRVGKGPAPTAPIAPEKPGVEPGAVIDTGEADRQAAADEANKLAQDIFAGITDEDVDVRASVKLLADLKEKIEAGLAGVEEEEKPQSLADLFQAEKAKLGLDVLETELADLDADIDRIQTQLLVQAEEAGEKIISATEIGRAKGVLQKRADREIALLNVERSAVARTINNKLATLEIVMNLTQADFTNASAYYDRQFTRSIQLYNLISGAEAAEETRAERATNNAQFNLTTLTNLFKAMGASYDDLSDANKQSLRRLELEAGFPVGLTESFMSAKPNAEALTTVTGYDAAGNQIITFVYADEDGMPGTIRTVVTGGRKEEKAPTAAETKEAELSTIEGSLFATRGTDGFVDPGAYQSLRTKAAIGPTEFDKRFSHMLSPAERRRLGITIGEEEGFGTASEQSKVKAWIMENDTGEAQERNLERIKTSETYFYWVLNQIEGEGGWTP